MFVQYQIPGSPFLYTNTHYVLTPIVNFIIYNDAVSDALLSINTMIPPL